MTSADVPQYSEMLWPALQAVAELGGSASISEIVETVIRRERFTDSQQAVLHNNGPETEIGYRLAWARTYLKGMGLLTNSARGVWALTDEGTGLLTDPSANGEQQRERVRDLWASHLAELRRARRAKSEAEPDEPDITEATDGLSWKEQLLNQLMGMAPAAFERLAQRLLREADFDSVNVTGQSGDGGIDGLGVYRLGLVASLFSSSASDTAEASAPARFATSAVQWRAEVIRVCSLLPDRSLPTRKRRQPETALLPSISLTATGYVTC